MILTGLIVIGGIFPQWGITSSYQAAMQLIELRDASTHARPVRSDQPHATSLPIDSKTLAPPMDAPAFSHP